uniref:BMA-TTH-1, isoform b n=1 Tax=Brugia malayi TaxID=6279 RepID=A0A1I9G1A0_BRUMA|nr:BMA-TTH-1, isoform b [Brugia malayi]
MVIFYMYREKVDENLKGEIKTHDTSKLRHAEVVEKNVLPTSVENFGSKKCVLIYSALIGTSILDFKFGVILTSLVDSNVVREQEEFKAGANEKGGMIHN